MSARGRQYAKSQVRQAKRRNATVKQQNSRREAPKSRRSNVGHRAVRQPFSPPEYWHESVENSSGYRIFCQSPGDGYRHVVEPHEIRDRLSELPEEFIEPLEVVQLSRMTRKKRSFPCYGMQWGATLYLYPLEESLTEFFYSPPQPTFFNEARMFGGRWQQEGNSWTLTWSESAIRDFYLNNILIHELGHLLDQRNSSYTDRERYAEWFAIEFGYRQTGGGQSRHPGRKTRRRHHVK